MSSSLLKCAPRLRVEATSVIVDQTSAAPGSSVLERAQHRNPASAQAMMEQQINSRLTRPLAPYDCVPLACVLKPNFDLRLIELVDHCFDDDHSLLRIPAKHPLAFQCIPVSRYFPSFALSYKPVSPTTATVVKQRREQLLEISHLLEQKTHEVFRLLPVATHTSHAEFDWPRVLQRFFEMDPPPGPEHFEREALFELSLAADTLQADIVMAPNRCTLAFVRRPNGSLQLSHNPL